MKNTLKTGLVILLVLALPTLAFAASPWASEDTYAKKSIGKLTFGLKNVVLGWTELFRKPIDSVRDGTNVLKGLGRGILNTVTYTVGGVLHTVTFPIPMIDIPIPDDGVKF